MTVGFDRMRKDQEQDKGSANILVIGLFMVVLMAIFPPWLYYDGYTSNQSSAGYHFVSDQPHVKSYAEMFRVSDWTGPTEFVGVRINFVRLIAQIFAVFFFSVGFELKRSGARYLFLFPFFAGLCATGALVLMVATKY